MSSSTGSELSHHGVGSVGLSAAARGELQAVLEQLAAGRGVLVRLADLMGGAVGQAARLGFRGIGMAPGLQDKLRGVAETAITRAFDIAILGLKQPADPFASRDGSRARLRGRLNQGAVAVSGAIGGFAGLTALLPDIGFTTLAIMREIATIAREQGEDLTTQDARRACLEVFALRPFVQSDDESELGFFSARAVLRGRPVVMLLSEVSSHYGLALSRKVALQMMPVAGALCGAALNAAFLAHYRSLARAHFTVRRLERQHGAGVREAVETIRGAMAERVSVS